LLATRLFDKAYAKMQATVGIQLRASNTLSVVIDESINISSHRIINTSLITNNKDCFYISNIKAEVRKLRAKEVTS
jgi:hypothetical protein